MTEEKSTTGGFWIGLMVGGLVALGLFVLFGSERGKKLLERFQEEGLDALGDIAEDVKDEVSEKVGQLEQKSEALVEKGQELLDQGKALQQEAYDTVLEARADVAENVAEKVDETLAHIERIQEHGRQSTADLRKQLFKNIPKRT